MWIEYCWDFKATVSSVSSSFDSIHFDEVVSFTLSLRSDLSWSNQEADIEFDNAGSKTILF